MLKIKNQQCPIKNKRQGKNHKDKTLVMVKFVITTKQIKP